MSESKHAFAGGHTAGPWRFEIETDRPYEPVIVGPAHAADASQFIAICCGGLDDHEREQYANARLIAAAPDLLAALIDCSEALAAARDKLGMCGEGDGKDRKADAADTIGSLSALTAARAAIALTTKPEGGQT